MNRGKERKRREEKGKETREREGEETREREGEGEERRGEEREGKHPINIQLITQLIHVIYVHVHPKQDNNN